MSVRLGAVEGWVVTQDGETIKTGFKDDFEAVGWLHRRQGQSIDWAVRYQGYDIVLVKNGKVVYSYRQAQEKRPESKEGERMSGKPFLGLHTKEERQHAYKLVYRVYQRALRAIQKGPSSADFNYALGYIEAIGDLVTAEAPDDTELLGLIGDMQRDLHDKYEIPT